DTETYTLSLHDALPICTRDRCQCGSATSLSRGARALMSAVKPENGGLALEGVRAGYGRTIVLDGISLSLAPGATLTLLGRNGVRSEEHTSELQSLAYLV